LHAPQKESGPTGAGLIPILYRASPTKGKDSKYIVLGNVGMKKGGWEPPLMPQIVDSRVVMQFGLRIGPVTREILRYA